MKIFERIKKPISCVVIFTFAVFSILEYAPRTAYADTRTQSVSTTQDALPSTIPIPSGLGSLERSFRGGPEKPTVYYIQDAHSSLEAQENIAKLIDHLTVTQGVRKVYVEGYEGDDAGKVLDRLYPFQDPETKSEVSRFFLDYLRLSGAQFGYINRKTDLQLTGIESAQDYLNDLQSYEDAAKTRSETGRSIDVIAKHLKTLADRLYPKEVQEYQKLKARLEAKQLELGDYVFRLMKLYGTSSIEHQASLKKYPSMGLVAGYLNKTQLTQAEQKELSEKLKAIDHQVFFSELKSFQDEFVARYLTSPVARETFRYQEKAGLFMKLNQLQLTPEEYRVMGVFAPGITAELAHFLAKNLKKPIVLNKEWETDIQDALRFYELAKKRDENFKKILSKPVKSMILVTGGFHTDSLTHFFEKEDISYVLIAPRITKEDPLHQERYDFLMSGGHYSFEPSIPKSSLAVLMQITQPIQAQQTGIEAVAEMVQAASRSVKGGQVDPKGFEAIIRTERALKASGKSLGDAFDPARQAEMIEKIIRAYREVRPEEEILIGELEPLANLDNGIAYGRFPKPDGSKGKPFYLGTGERLSPGATLAVFKQESEIGLVIRYRKKEGDGSFGTARLFWRNGEFVRQAEIANAPLEEKKGEFIQGLREAYRTMKPGETRYFGDFSPTADMVRGLLHRRFLLPDGAPHAALRFAPEKKGPYAFASFTLLKERDGKFVYQFSARSASGEDVKFQAVWQDGKYLGYADYLKAQISRAYDDLKKGRADSAAIGDISPLVRLETGELKKDFPFMPAGKAVERGFGAGRDLKSVSLEIARGADKKFVFDFTYLKEGSENFERSIRVWDGRKLVAPETAGQSLGRAEYLSRIDKAAEAIGESLMNVALFAVNTPGPENPVLLADLGADEKAIRSNFKTISESLHHIVPGDAMPESFDAQGNVLKQYAVLAARLTPKAAEDRGFAVSQQIIGDYIKNANKLLQDVLELTVPYRIKGASLGSGPLENPSRKLKIPVGIHFTTETTARKILEEQKINGTALTVSPYASALSDQEFFAKLERALIGILGYGIPEKGIHYREQAGKAMITDVDELPRVFLVANVTFHQRKFFDPHDPFPNNDFGIYDHRIFDQGVLKQVVFTKSDFVGKEVEEMPGIFMNKIVAGLNEIAASPDLNRPYWERVREARAKSVDRLSQQGQSLGMDRQMIAAAQDDFVLTLSELLERKDRLSYDDWKNSIMETYADLLERTLSAIELKDKETVFVYPFMGPDLIPALFRRTIAINNDPFDVSERGSAEIGRVFGWGARSRALEHAVNWREGRDALNPQSYKPVLEDPAPHVLLLKGFSRFGLKAGRESVLKMLDYLLVRVLKRGDRVLILDTIDLDFMAEALARLPEDVRAQFSPGAASARLLDRKGGLAFHADDKILAVPNVVSLIEKTGPVEGASLGKPQLSLEEAKQLFQWVISNGRDEEYSTRLAEETLQRPIQNILMVGGGLMAYPFLMALMGKSIIVVEKDPAAMELYTNAIRDLKVLMDEHGIKGVPDLWVYRWPDEIAPDYLSEKIGPSALDLVTFIDIGKRKDFASSLDQWIQGAKVWANPSAYFLMDETADAAALEFKKAFPQVRPAAPGKSFKGYRQRGRSRNKLVQLVSGAAGALDFFREKDWKGTYAADSFPALKNGFLAVDGDLRKMEEQFVPKDPTKIFFVKKSEFESYERNMLAQYRALSDSLQHIIPGDVFLTYYGGKNLLDAYHSTSDLVYDTASEDPDEKILSAAIAVYIAQNYTLLRDTQILLKDQAVRGRSLGKGSETPHADAYLPRIAQSLKTISKELEKLGGKFIPKNPAQATRIAFHEVAPYEENIRSQFRIVSDSLQHVVPGDKMTDLIGEGSVKNRYDVIAGRLSLASSVGASGEFEAPSTALAAYYTDNFALIGKVVEVIESYHTKGKSLGDGLRKEFEKDIASDKRFETFKTYDFRGSGPQSATRYYTEFKDWYNKLKEREEEIVSSRDEGLKQLFRKATERYSYVIAKIIWIWHLESLGEKIRSFQDKENADGAKQAANDLLKRHENFMANHPNAPFLQNDPSVKTALKDIHRLLGITEPKAAILPAKSVETARPAPEVKGPATAVEVAGARAPPAPASVPKAVGTAGPVKWVDWKRAVITLSGALALSAVFYLILPVNLFTVSLALILPLSLFIIFKTSWPAFLLSIGLSVALAIFLPIPWFGLSLAAIAIAQLVLGPARPLELQGPGAVSPASGEKGPALKEAEILGIYQKKFGALPLSTDILGYVLRIAALMTAGRSATKSDLEKIDLRSVLDTLFQVRPSELIPEDGALKERLKPLVRARIQSLELGFDISVLEAIRKLKHWPQENKDTLARALQEITGEIARDLSPQLTAKDSDQAPLAIQEIVGEYFRIDKERFLRVQLSLMLLLVRERMESDRILGIASAEHLFLEGRIEFFFKNYRIAAQAFESAVRLEPSNAHYLLTAGIVDHYLKKWDQAQVFYKRSLDIREQVKQPTEIEKLRTELNRLLLQKAKAKIPFEGSDSEKVKGASLGHAERHMKLLGQGAYELIHLAEQFQSDVFIMREDVGKKKKVRITSERDIDILGLRDWVVTDIRLIAEGPDAQDAVEGIYSTLNSHGFADDISMDFDRLTPPVLAQFIKDAKRSISTEALVRNVISLEEIRQMEPVRYDEVQGRLLPEDQEFLKAEEEWVKNNRAPPKMPRIPVEALLKQAPQRTPEDIRMIRDYQAADQARVRWQAHIENIWYRSPMFADKGAVADAQIDGSLVPVLGLPQADKPWVDSETPIMLAKRGEEIEPMYRVLTPEARNLLWDLVIDLRAVEFEGEQLLSKEKLVVTSLTRDAEKQEVLNQTEGVTANIRSTHGVGEAFDIWLDYFKNPPAQESEGTRKRLLAHYDALMSTLNQWKKEGRINLIIEYDGKVAHVARNPHFVTGKSLGWEDVLKDLRIDDQRGGKTIFKKPIVAWLDTYIPGAKWQLSSFLVKYFIQDPHEEKDNRNRFDGWIRYHETIKHWEKMKEFISAEYARNIPHEADEVKNRLAEMTVDTMILARADYLSKHKRRYESKALSAATPEDLKKARRLKAYLYKAVNSEAWRKLGEYRLWDLPIWFVNSKNEVLTDLMRWIRAYPDAPPEEWYDPVRLKSLAQITGSREPIERPKPQEPPRQLSLFDDLAAGNAGVPTTPARPADVDRLSGQSLGGDHRARKLELLGGAMNFIQGELDDLNDFFLQAKNPVDIASDLGRQTVQIYETSLSEKFKVVSEALPSVIPGDDDKMIAFLKKGNVLKRYDTFAARLRGNAITEKAVRDYAAASGSLLKEVRTLTSSLDFPKGPGFISGRSLGRTESRIKIHGVVLDVTLDKSLRNLLKMQKDISNAKYDITDPDTAKAFMRSKAALRDDLGSVSNSLLQVVPGDDLVDFLKKGTVLEQYWDILERLYGGNPAIQVKFEPSEKVLSAYVAESLALVREILKLVEHARGRADAKGAPIPEGKGVARNVKEQVRVADVVIEDIRLDLQKIEEFFIETTYDPEHPLRLDDLIEFETDVSDNFDVLTEVLALIVPPSEKTGVQAIRDITSGYKEISERLANSADATKRKVITKKALSAYVRESRSLLRQANSLVKPFRTKGSSLGEDIMDKKILWDATGDLADKSMPIEGLEPALVQPIRKIADIYRDFYDKDPRAPRLSIRPTDEKVYKAKYTEKGTFEPSNIWDLAEIFLKAGVKPGDSILDLGSGDGRVLAVASLFGAKVTGYEYDSALYGIAQDLLGRMAEAGLIDRSRITFKQGDFLNEPFGAHKFIFYFDQGSKDRARIVQKFLAEARPEERFLLYRAQGLRGTDFQDLGFVRHIYLIPLQEPFGKAENRTLTIMKNPKGFLAPPSSVLGKSLGAARSYGNQNEIAQEINAMENPAPVFVDMTDYGKFSDKQRNEFLMLALQKKIKAVIYNDAESRVNADPNLAGLKNVISYRGDAAGAFAVYGQTSSEKIIHLSRETDARKDLDRNRFYFFRQAGEESGALLVALLYQLSDGKLQGVEEKDGFLVVDINSALLKLTQEYEAGFEIAKAA